MNIFINLEDFFIFTDDVKHLTVAGFELERSRPPERLIVFITFNSILVNIHNGFILKHIEYFIYSMKSD